MAELRSPLQARLVQWLVAPGDSVRKGAAVAILEAMKKMERMAVPQCGPTWQACWNATRWRDTDMPILPVDRW